MGSEAWRHHPGRVESESINRAPCSFLFGTVVLLLFMLRT